MPIDLAKLGTKLSEARASRKLTQDEAARAIGVSRSAIALIESGTRSISTLELAGLAALYNQPIAEFFTEVALAGPGGPLALCRVAPEFEANPDLGRTVSRLLDVCQDGVQLERLLDRGPRTGPRAYPKSHPKSYVDAVEHGKEVADEERRRLALGDAPIADIADLVAGQGIWAAATTLPGEMSGLFLHDEAMGFVILVNSSHPRARKRFSYAHEYAHALLDRNYPVTVSTATTAKELIERRANAFAAAFLMPKAGVESLLRSLGKGAPSRAHHLVYDVATEAAIAAERRPAPGSQEVTPRDVAAVAQHFGTSYQATCYRLIDLGYLNREELQPLLDREAVGNGFLSMLKKWEDLFQTEPNEPERELGAQIVPLAVEAFRRETISRGKLFELGAKLGLSAPKLAELAEV